MLETLFLHFAEEELRHRDVQKLTQRKAASIQKIQAKKSLNWDFTGGPVWSGLHGSNAAAAGLICDGALRSYMQWSTAKKSKKKKGAGGLTGRKIRQMLLRD